MAQRRMFSPDIIDSDAFLDMPHTSQLLYFHLSMRADDDGFVNPKKIMRMIGSSNDDLKVLLTKRFLLPFESGVVVIKHWLIHNLIRKDRYKKTLYIEEKKLLTIKENGSYTEAKNNSGNQMTTSGIPNDNQMATQVRLGKVSIGKDNIIPADKPQASFKRLPTEKQQIIHRIVYYLEDTLKTHIVNWKKQAKALSMMQKAGYTEKQILFTIKYMAGQDFYSDKGFDLMTVANNISQVKASIRKGAINVLPKTN